MLCVVAVYELMKFILFKIALESPFLLECVN